MARYFQSVLLGYPLFPAGELLSAGKAHLIFPDLLGKDRHEGKELFQEGEPALARLPSEALRQIDRAISNAGKDGAEYPAAAHRIERHRQRQVAATLLCQERSSLLRMFLADHERVGDIIFQLRAFLFHIFFIGRKKLGVEHSSPSLFRQGDEQAPSLFFRQPAGSSDGAASDLQDQRLLVSFDHPWFLEGRKSGDPAIPLNVLQRLQRGQREEIFFYGKQCLQPERIL